MSTHKHIDKICLVAALLALLLCTAFVNGEALGIQQAEKVMGYEARLFDTTRVHTIDIVMNNWDNFIETCESEEYAVCSVVIDGEACSNVGIRAKGNTSLSTVSSMNSDRYSFKIEFDQYDSTKTYHGLDKLSLNNLIQDSTMMKDYLTYQMMGEFGAAAPLCSYVYITVNGEDWGLYLAVEAVEDSFFQRNYGNDYGELYKPDSMSFGGGRGNGKDFNMDDFMNREESAGESWQGNATPNQGRFDPSAMFGGEMPNMGNFVPSQMSGGFSGEMPDMGNFDFSQMLENFGGATPSMGNFDFSQMQGGMPQMPGTTQNSGESEGSDKSSFGSGFNFGGMGGFGMGSSDVKLQYIDDNPSSYSNIWNNAKTDITAADQSRLIESLKKLSSKEDLESVVNMDEVIRYFVVHNYVCNGDSYTGSMIHNYYLYEEDGQLSMLPWDYNLAFGTFQGGNGQSTVNTPIDAPVSGGAGEDRPMWNWILSDESYTELYHQYFAEFLNTVDVQAIIDNAYNLIKPYVEKDPTAFYTCEEFEAGVETMRRFCALRSESISAQLANGETTANMNYVDASGLTLSNMGSMGGGFSGGFGGGSTSGRENNKGNFGSQGSSEGTTSSRPAGNKNNSFGTSGQGSSASAPAGIPQSSGTPALPEGLDSSWLQGGVNGQMPNMGEMPQGFAPSQMPESFDFSQMQGGFVGMFPGQSSGETESTPSDHSGNNSFAENNQRPSRDNMQMPSGNFNPNMNSAGNAASSRTDLIWLAVSVLILGMGMLIAKLYKR